jgi:UDP-N-acetylglucosamine 4,6-dehydratase
MFDGKTLLVTGGTGSFGNDFVKLVLAEHAPRRVIVFSRDEKKQHDMRLAFADDRLRFVIGDIRDRSSIGDAMRGVNFVFHAAALKQVPSCEFFPIEAVRTNVLGTHNVLEAAEEARVEKLVVLSTDKAVQPINAMGQTKALMEKLAFARALSDQSRVTYCGVRYGNVMYSRGSVIPLFIQQIKAGKPITITEPRMTRLLLPLAEAVKLVTFAMENGRQGDLFVRKATSATVQVLAEALLSLFGADNPIDIVGVRAGEKLHEMLVTPEELRRAEEFDDYYRVPCEGGQDYDRYFTEGDRTSRFVTEGYTSENAYLLSVEETQQLLLGLPDVQAELDGWKSKAPRLKVAA